MGRVQASAGDWGDTYTGHFTAASNGKQNAREKGTTGGAKVLPRINRVDPTAPPPALQPEDAVGGMLSLMNRGLIPGGTDLTPALPAALLPTFEKASR